MKRPVALRSKVGISALVLLAVLITGGVVQHKALWRWYAIRQLAKAPEGQRQVWVERVARLGNAAVPGLIDCLAAKDAVACENAHSALRLLVEQSDVLDPGRPYIANRLAESFSRLSVQGQQVCLSLDASLVLDAPAGSRSAEILQAAEKAINLAVNVPDKDVHRHALELAGVILDGQLGDPAACAAIVRVCMQSEDSQIRLAGLQLALKPGMNLLESVVPLLRDPVAEIRRLAMLSVGASPAVISTDDLLPWLHDPDPQVCYFCEEALRGRGLRESHLQLGRLMTASQPGTRLQVFDMLRHATDLEPGVWLRRLSHDPAPAVRAAAARAAAQDAVELADRLEQMAASDPCLTVRQLAQYYLAFPRRKQSISSGQ